MNKKILFIALMLLINMLGASVTFSESDWTDPLSISIRKIDIYPILRYFENIFSRLYEVKI